MKKHDVIIIGGGPGGSTLAAYLAKQGVDVAIIEREEYPRFHIGESLLPATMPIFKETGFYETLGNGKYLPKYGARFVDYLTDDEIYFGFTEGFNREIPFAYEVLRSEFDKDILENAKKCGATVYQPERVKEVSFYDGDVTLKTNKGEYSAKYVADASGRDAILSKMFKIRTANHDLNNVGVFSHYTGVKRGSGQDEGDIIIGLLPNGAWSWMIPFKGEHTSVGIVSSSKVFNPGTDLSEYIETTLSKSKVLGEYMIDADRTQEMTAISNYSHRCSQFAGDRWILIGDAAAFLDPIFSSGVHVSCTSARFASQVLAKALQTNCSLKTNGMGEQYQIDMERGIKRFHALISMFYQSNFVANMKKTLLRENMRQAFTSAVAGDMWNEDNFLFKMGVL